MFVNTLVMGNIEIFLHDYCQYHDYHDYCLFDYSNENTLNIMNSHLNDKIYDNSFNYVCLSRLLPVIADFDIINLRKAHDVDYF